MFIDPAEEDLGHGGISTASGIENSSVVVHQNHAIRSRDNLYEYRDTPGGGVGSSGKGGGKDSHSMRSPSSLGATQTTRSGSQNSLRSAISLKESVMTTATPQQPASYDKSLKYSERIPVEPNPKGKFDDSRNLLTTYDKSRETVHSVASSAEQPLRPSTLQTNATAGGPTPVPSTRKNLKASRTHLIEGIPQTEV